MEVLCKEYERCEYKNMCSHSKPHNLIEGEWNGDNCVLGHVGEPCHCSSKFLRKDKLKKLKYEN